MYLKRIYMTYLQNIRGCTTLDIQTISIHYYIYNAQNF